MQALHLSREVGKQPKVIIKYRREIAGLLEKQFIETEKHSIFYDGKDL